MASISTLLKIGNSEVCIDDIPPEILDMIFEYMNLTTKRKCRLVCKQWKSSVDRSLNFSFELCTFNIKWFRGLSVELNTLTVYDLISNYAKISTNQDKSVLQTVQEIKFSSSAEFEYETFEIIIANSNNLRSLAFDACFFNSLKFNTLSPTNLNWIQLENLRKISISISAYTHAYGILAVFSLNVPNLEELETKRTFACSCCGPFYGTDVVRAYLEFVVRHKKNLKILRALNTLISSVSPNSSPQLADEEMKSKDIELLNGLAEVNLETLQIKHITYTTGDWKFPAKLINSQKSLKQIQTDLQPTTTAIDFGQLLLQNYATLSVIHIMHNQTQNIHFDCAWLTDMKSLVDFGILTRSPIRNINQLPATIETIFWSAPLTRNQIRLIGQTVKSLKMLSLRDVFIQSDLIAEVANEQVLRENINLDFFREIASFPKLQTLVGSENDFGEHLDEIENYCFQFEELVFKRNEYRRVMAVTFYERSFVINIRRNE